MKILLALFILSILALTFYFRQEEAVISSDEEQVIKELRVKSTDPNSLSYGLAKIHQKTSTLEDYPQNGDRKFEKQSSMAVDLSDLKSRLFEDPDASANELESILNELPPTDAQNRAEVLSLVALLGNEIPDRVKQIGIAEMEIQTGLNPSQDEVRRVFLALDMLALPGKEEISEEKIESILSKHPSQTIKMMISNFFSHRSSEDDGL